MPRSDADAAPVPTPAADERGDDDTAVGALTGGGMVGPVVAGGALTDALDRGLRSAGAALDTASSGQVALGLVGAATLAFALQVLALAGALRPVAVPSAPRLTLGPAPAPFPRPPAGGAARPLPFSQVTAFGGPRLARAA